MSGGHSTEWYGDEVKLALKGLRKENLRKIGGPARTEYLLNKGVVMALYQYNLMMGNAQKALAILVGWMFLLRVQSEGPTMWKGEVSDLVSLPEDRDNGYFCKKGTLHLVLRTRKHRQGGSHLKLQCCCNDEKYCVHCELLKYYEATEPDQTLWDFNNAQLLRQLKGRLQNLGIVEYVNLTWKSFRAGRATEMANDGLALDKYS